MREGGGVLKTLADPSFFRLFHALLDEPRIDPGQTRWKHCGLEWTHMRQSFAGPDYSFALHQYLMAKTSPRGWLLLVVKEHWWATADNANLRSVQWAKPLAGKRTQIMEWLRAEDRRIATKGAVIQSAT